MGNEKKILPQYDDPVTDEVKFLFTWINVLKIYWICHPQCDLLQGVTLDASGRFTGEAEKKLEEVIIFFVLYSFC